MIVLARTKAFLLLIFVLFLVSCGPLTGRVIEKEIEPEYVEWYSQIIGADGSSVMLPRINEAQYILVIDTGEDIEDVRVSEETFAKTRIGEAIVIER